MRTQARGASAPPIDDLTLMAFADGELDEARALAVHDALRRDPELRETVRIMRETSALLRTAYGAVAAEPVPAELVHMVAAAPASPPRRPVLPPGLPTGLPAGLPPRAAPPAASHPPVSEWRRLATAASIALLAGISAGWPGLAPGLGGALPDADWTAGRDPAAHVVQAALEREISGTEISWTDPDSSRSVTVQPIRTFRAADQTFCREYRETRASADGPAHTVYGLACRAQGGVWNVQSYLVPGDAPDATRTN